MTRIYFTSLLSLIFSFLYAQDPTQKQLDHPDFAIWKTIQNEQISATGQHVTYRLVPGEGNPVLCIYADHTQLTDSIPRVSQYQLDYNGLYVVAKVTPHRDTLRDLERRKVDKKKWPCDTLLIRNLITKEITRIPWLSNYQMPAKHGGWLAYTVKPEGFVADSLREKLKSKKDIVHLVIRELATGKEDTLRHIKSYSWADGAPVLSVISAKTDSTQITAVWRWKDWTWKKLKTQEGEYSSLGLSMDGTQISFLGNLDTTKAQIQPWELFYFTDGSDSAKVLASPDQSDLPMVSQHESPSFSENGHYLYYGRAKTPLIQDTTLLPDEIVDVEVWSTDDPDLYTVQNVLKSREEKRSYTCAYDTRTKKHIRINSLQYRSNSFADKRNTQYVALYTDEPYRKLETWLVDAPRDIAVINLQTGLVREIKKNLLSVPRVSPNGLYTYGYSVADSTWWAHHNPTGVTFWMKTEGLGPFYDEENDVPDHPGSYGSAGWTTNDEALILYDRYDLWSWKPSGGTLPVRITDGRPFNLVYRYVKTDPEETNMSSEGQWLLHVRDDQTKSTNYNWFNPVDQSKVAFRLEPYYYSRSVQKPRSSDETFLFTRENFQTFPDLNLTKNRFTTNVQISNANPQQSEYSWGTIELYEWIDFDSVKRTGMLVKPAHFDTLRSYPTIVNFYEHSSNGLHDHPTPMPHRSTINYAFYASRGYVIFNPDISYEVGLPGESAYQIVVSGVMSLVKKRVIDPDRVALQGHSWGGYQIAYIVSRTDMFTCAEAGAVVSNMTSAYGGIRWETGRARQFQYERSQSRLGKTLWEDPGLYIKNSPLFKADKINTPLLLMHNDADGHVPFEQGVELYLALRRLDKTAWLLNYRGEPHWPLKLHQRKDFQLRMSQFFDHYLKGAPMPVWMEKGVPAVERGINPGY